MSVSSSNNKERTFWGTGEHFLTSTLSQTWCGTSLGTCFTTSWQDWRGTSRQSGLDTLDIWQHLATFGNIWQHLATFCKICQHLATFSNNLPHLATLDKIWQHLAIFGNIWQHFKKVLTPPPPTTVLLPLAVRKFPIFSSQNEKSSKQSYCSGFFLTRSGSGYNYLKVQTSFFNFKKIWTSMLQNGFNIIF